MSVASSWLPKISNLASHLAILFASTQLGFHFWPDSAFVFGARIDYLAPTLYLLDMLIIISLLTQPPSRRSPSPPLLLIPLLLVNLVFSQNPLATLTWSTRFLLYLSFTLSLLPSLRAKLPSLLLIPVVFQSTLGLAQLLLRHSLQGPLYFLGERHFALGQPALATFEFFGNLLPRAYGTFSHPNVLAGFLVVSTTIIILVSSSNPLQRKFIYPSLLATTIALILTQSRAAALTLFGFIVPFSLLRSLRSRLIYFLLLLIPTLYLALASPFSRPTDTSIEDRLSLQQLSFTITRHYPLFGVGANASITRYPDLAPTWRFLQPDHNSLTLFVSWFGLLGTIALVVLAYSRAAPTPLLSLALLLPLFTLDHYLLTSSQGLFILLLFLSTVLPYSHAESHQNRTT